MNLRMSVPVLCLFAVCIGSGCTRSSDKTLTVYCGVSMRPPMEELADLYREETGTKIEFLYGDSGTLLSQAELTGKGDIYICHDPFMAAARSKGLVDRDWTVGYLYPVIIVTKGNSADIHSIRDLAREGLRVGLGDQRYSTCGNIITTVLRKAGLSESIGDNVVLRARTSSEIANHLNPGYSYDFESQLYSSSISYLWKLT
jgi:molybdate transport system substrate-binding protein